MADADSTWNAQPGAMPAVLWQAHLVNDLLRAYAPFAYGPDGKRVLVAARLASKSRVGLLNDTAAAVRSTLELQEECSEDQLSHCADAVWHSVFRTLSW